MEDKFIVDVSEDFFAPLVSAFDQDIYELLYNYNNNKSWLMDTPGLGQGIARKGLEDNNMFFRPQFLHNGSLVRLADGNIKDGVLASVSPNGVYGKVDLENTFLPMLPYSSGMLVVALDPARRLADQDREDNVFVEFVYINSTTWDEPNPLCSVTPKDFGKASTIMNYVMNIHKKLNRKLFPSKFPIPTTFLSTTPPTILTPDITNTRFIIYMYNVHCRIVYP